MTDGRVRGEAKDAVKEVLSPLDAEAGMAAVNVVQRLDEEGLLRDRPPMDPYFGQIEAFHRQIRESTDEHYLDLFAEDAEATIRQAGFREIEARGDDADVLIEHIASLLAERNRLFWAAFLAEETGEVADALVSGEPTGAFREELADVLIVTFGVFEAMGYDPLAAFDSKMEENFEKPKQPGEGTGKLDEDGRREWEP